MNWLSWEVPKNSLIAVDQRLGGDRLGVLGGHALAHDPLHPRQADADLVLDQLADRAQPPVAEVVLVVGAGRGVALVQPDQVVDGGHDVVGGQGQGLVLGVLQAQLLVDLVAADLGQVVALGLEEEAVQELAAGLGAGRLARAQAPVDLDQRVLFGLGVVLLQGAHHGLGVAEALADLLVAHAEAAQQHGHGQAALAVEAHADGVLLVDVELEPRASGRDDPAGGEQLVEGLVGLLLEDDAGRADQLGGDHALGAVDDEGALVGHDREVAHEDRLGLDLAGGSVLELGLDVELAGVGVVSLPALLDRMLGLLEAVLPEGERHLAGEVLDGADLIEGLTETVSDQPLEGLALDGDEIGDGKDLGDLAEGES
jgi:hypothetical protein